MGKKSERLEEELELVNGELIAERRMRVELEQQLAAAGLRPAATPTNYTMTMRHPSPFADDRPLETAAARLAETMQRAHPPDPANLVFPNSTLDGGTDDAEQAIRDLRNAPLPVEKQETLKEIVDRNNWERAQLNESQRKANVLISRVASALGVTRWDNDGTEIVEKAQRFSVFHLWLSRRLKELIQAPPMGEAGGPSDIEEAADHDVRIGELRTVISALVAQPQLSKFLHERLTAQAVAPKSIFEVAAETERPAIGTASRRDVLALRDAYAVWAADHGEARMEWLVATAKSEEATAILLELVNLVLVPTLVRLKLVTR